MSEFVIYCSNEEETPSDFKFELPPSFDFRGHWECALLEISLDCQFTPEKDRLYLCADFLDESFINRLRAPVLRNVEVKGNYNQTLIRAYDRPIYKRIRSDLGHQLRFRLLDGHLHPVTFVPTSTVHCVLRFRRWAP